MTQRHVVIVAPPWYPVPPRGYGGVELVVGLLADALRQAGDRITLLAAEGSQADAIELAPRAWSADLGTPAERLREVTYASRVSRTLAQLGRIDVIHDHCGFATLVAACAADVAPVVHTVHGDIPEAYATFYSSVVARAGFVAISSAQRRSLPDLPWIGMVHNAVDVQNLMVTPAQKVPFLLCLARICPDKGQHIAIEVARRTGMRLVLAGKVESTPQSTEYFRRQIEPFVDGIQILHFDNVVGYEKALLLARASALLAPLQWDEPFGLALVEAMASGTPVIAFGRGAAPELVTDGKTGFLVNDVNEMVSAVSRVPALDSSGCAAATRARFSAAAMASSYRHVYDKVACESDASAEPAGLIGNSAA